MASGPYPYHCPDCGQGVFSHAALVEHRRSWCRNIGQDGGTVTYLPTVGPEHGPFFCHDCGGRWFHSRRALGIHQASHDRPAPQPKDREPMPPPAAQRDLGPGDDWRDFAACAPYPPDVFFPEQGGDVERAKTICQLCTVRERCLEFALRERIYYGVWGGKSEKQRRALRRRRRRVS